MLETYITHIRITEYASHPSSPPPPQARASDSEKPRVIIVAVRQSGRVRMHKSKENTSGTFSIGKSWNLDDLSHIESFTGPQVNPNYREWAGETGFLVTLGKPYFWHTQTDKEKKFFIASLIKIYGKYTGGKLPDLAGFDPKELDQVLGAGRRHPAANSKSPITEIAPSHQSISSGTSAAPSPSTILPPSKSSTPEPMRFQNLPPAVRPPLNGGGSPAVSSDSITSRERPPAPRWTAQNNRSQDSVANSFAARSDDASLPPRSRNGMGGPGTYGRIGDSREPPELPQDKSAPHLEEKPPPERRRPPMDPSRPQDRDLVPPPLMSPNVRREPVPLPPRNTDRASSRKNTGPGAAALPGGLKGRDAPAPLDTNMAAEPLPDRAADTSMPTTPAIDITTPLEPSPGQDRAEDNSRPGLGPMIKAKKSKGDLAGALWKAASVAASFRPRPGGAGDRLRQPQGKVGVGPDGITGVVPAPPRPASRGLRSATPDVATPDDNDSNVPEVKVTASDPGLPATADLSLKEEKKKREEPGKEEPRRSVVAGNDVKYLQSLGIDSSVLDDRSEEFGKWLDYFGWVPGQQMRSQSMDEVRADIERELNKAQAGGWLARFQDEDERVDAIKQGIDLAISECEEMDNLLTLYAVELSVRRILIADGTFTDGSHRHFRMTLHTLRPKAKAFRCRRPTRSYSRRSLSLFWRPAPSLPKILRRYEWLPWRTRAGWKTLNLPS